MTVMMAVGGGASQGIQTKMRNPGANTIVLNLGALKSSGVSKGEGSRASVTFGRRAGDRERSPGCGRGLAAAQFRRDATDLQQCELVHPGHRYDIEYLTIRNWAVSRGRASDREDVVQASKVVLLGRTVAEKLFAIRARWGRKSA